jgi:hypothetical protein
VLELRHPVPLVVGVETCGTSPRKKWLLSLLVRSSSQEFVAATMTSLCRPCWSASCHVMVRCVPRPGRAPSRVVPVVEVVLERINLRKNWLLSLLIYLSALLLPGRSFLTVNTFLVKKPISNAGGTRYARNKAVLD